MAAPQKRHENPEIAAMLRRMVRAYGDRVGEADPYDLADMLDVLDEANRAVDRAVDRLHERGYSWQEIGDGAGLSRQAAHRRWRRNHVPGVSVR